MNRCVALFRLLLCGCAALSAASEPAAPPTQPNAVDLAQRYPTTLDAGDYDVTRAREWTFAPDDIFELSSFALSVGKNLNIEIAAADLGIGHCVDGAAWALVIPRDKGEIKSEAGGTELIDHVWLRFHPRVIDKLLPPDTVRGPGDKALLERMQRIARFKLRANFHAGDRVLIPEPKDLIVDADTRDRLRRLFVVDRDAGSARYNVGAAARAVPVPKPLDEQVAAVSFDQLWNRFDREYAMFALRPEVDWNALREQYRPQALACKTSYDFAQVCAAMLRHLRDLHIWIKVDGEPVEVFNRPRTTNANPAARAALVGQLNQTRKTLAWSTTDDKIGYVAIDGWSDDGIPDAFDQLLELMRDTRGLIVDVRINGGGSEPLAQQVAARFADRTLTYAYHRTHNGPRHDDLTEKQPRTLDPRGPWRYDRPVVVLIGERCMSSNESFVSMMEQCPQVTTMGDRTCGSSGNPTMLSLPAGVEVSLPQWIDLLSDGTPLDERGVQPKVRFEAGPEAFTGQRDDLLTAALERLRKEPLPAQPVATATPTSSAPPADTNDVAALWNRILDANRAWLDPAPAAITIRGDRLDRASSPDTQPIEWRRTTEAETAAAGNRSARLVRRLFAGDGSVITEDSRYVAGVGGRLKRTPLPPAERSRKLDNDQWLAARIGILLRTSMHAAVVNGLPPATTATQEGDLITLHLTAPPPTAPPAMVIAWSHDHPTYGILPTQPDVEAANVKTVDWEFDAATLRPRRVLEHGLDEVTVTFDPAWLPCGSAQVPQHIVVHRGSTDADYMELAYEMQCVDSAWAIKLATKRQVTGGRDVWPADSRFEVREVSLNPLPPDTFELPTDVELPEHSYTELKPGQRIVTFRTADGLTLEGKLSLPPDASGPVPIAMLLPGSGPWTFDHPIRIPKPDQMFESELINYLDLYATELTARGVGFFSTNKRGCAQIKEEPYVLVRRAIFSKATPPVLLDDYAAALAALRTESGVSADRIVLIGVSEGTALVPRLALRSPTGVAGLVLAGFAEDNTHDTIVWQNTVGPWRNMARVFDLNDDNRITREEWQQAKPDLLFKLRLGRADLDMCDLDRNGVIEPRDLAAANASRLDANLRAVKDGDDEWLWWNLLNLSSASLRTDWERAPLHEELLQVQVPIHIIHGTHDGAVRVEGAQAAEAAFRKAGRTNLVMHILPRTDHDLNYGTYLDTYFAGRPQTPDAMKVMFDAAAEVARGRE